ncbi:MAG: iron ABC transporter permease [Candidatus Methanomethylophilaceae archaeon]|nr:iron ABC transporter permease [Candidatus Methanomethylophilaceae archaeon]
MVLLLFIFILLEISTVSKNMTLSDIFLCLIHSDQSIYTDIVWTYTMPRIVIALVIGAGLAICGAAMQALFKNPMASPYILGLSSGASVGASIAILFTIPFIPELIAAPVMAFIFCMMTTFLVYGLAKGTGMVSTESLILIGMAISSLFSAVVSLLTVLAGEKMSNIVFWTMGSLAQYNWDKVLIVMPIIILGSLMVMSYSRELNAIMLGDAHAKDLGIEVRKVRLTILLITSLITAACVAFTGVIGFVGLVIPHIVRLLMGPDNRYMMPFSIAAGALFLLVCDYISRVAFSGDVLPIGVVTAIIGAPYFIYLIYKRKSEVGW